MLDYNFCLKSNCIFAPQNFTMRNYYIIFLVCICFSFTTAQIVYEDASSGGTLYVKSQPNLDAFLKKSIHVTCAQPKPPAKVDPCVNNPKIMGYKIQIMYSKNRNSASSAIQQFSAEFPGISPELSYSQPDYKVLVGDYFTKRSAAMDLSRIKKSFPGAFLVQWRVWCRKAK